MSAAATVQRPQQEPTQGGGGVGWGNLDGVELGLGAADAFDGDDVAAVDAAERREARVDRLVNHLRNVEM